MAAHGNAARCSHLLLGSAVADGADPCAIKIQEASLHILFIAVCADERFTGRLEAADGGDRPGVRLHLVSLRYWVTNPRQPRCPGHHYS